MVVDCTGDADVCHQAGAPYERAGDIDPAQTLTTTFRMANVDVQQAQAFGKKAMAQTMEEAAAERALRAAAARGQRAHHHPGRRDPHRS